MTEGTQPAGGWPPPGEANREEVDPPPQPPNVESMPDPVPDAVDPAILADVTPPEPAPPPPAAPAQPAWPPSQAGPAPTGWTQPPAAPAQPAWPPPAAPAQPAWPPSQAGPAPTGWQPPAAPAQPAWPPAAGQVQAGWGSAAPTGAPTTSGPVVLAGIFLLVVGILTFGLFALVGVLGGLVASVGTRETGFDIFGPIGTVIAGVAILFVFWGILEIVAAIGMFIHRGWGRALGLIVGVIGTLFMALVLAGVAGSGDANAGGLGFSLVLLAGYGVTVLALLTGGAHFRRRN